MDTAIFAALGEPTRFKIVELLRERPLTVGEIADRLSIRQPQASKHLRVLSQAGLVIAKVDANRRIYRLQPEPFQQMDIWLSACRQMWEDRFDRLETYLKSLEP